jgi:hypothetical protein
MTCFPQAQQKLLHPDYGECYISVIDEGQY